MGRPVHRWAAGWATVLGLVLVGSAIVLTAISRSVLLALHPAHLMALGVLALGGALVLVRAARLRRRTSDPSRGPALRVIGRTVAAGATALAVGSLIYLVPFAAAPNAIDATSGSDGVAVQDSATQILIEPTAKKPDRGLVFQPGARVDPRAYVPLLEQVSRSGVLVVIVKQPFEIGFTAAGAPGGIIDAHPEVRTWAVGGHSLGGVAAATFARDHTDVVAGLVLWASYPLGSLADSSLGVASVSGSEDGLATPADIDASRPDLPSTTVFTEIPGGVHAFFGDYGAQPGDGAATTSRSAAQRQVVDATVALLQSL